MSNVLKASNIVKTEGTFKIPYIDENAPAELMETEQQTEEGYVQEITREPLPSEIAEQIIQNATKEAESLVENALLEKQEILQQAQMESERILHNAFEEGYAKGMDGANTQVEGCIADTLSALKAIQTSQQAAMKQYEHHLHNLAVDIASKILYKRVEADQTEMIPMIKNAIASVRGVGWIAIEISDKMQTLFSRLKLESIFEDSERIITLHTKDLPFGSCTLETEQNVLDASIDVQLENLRELLEISGRD